jgi:hypothetical protein
MTWEGREGEEEEEGVGDFLPSFLSFFLIRYLFGREGMFKWVSQKVKSDGT